MINQSINSNKKNKIINTNDPINNKKIKIDDNNIDQNSNIYFTTICHNQGKETPIAIGAYSKDGNCVSGVYKKNDATNAFAALLTLKRLLDDIDNKSRVFMTDNKYVVDVINNTSWKPKVHTELVFSLRTLVVNLDCSLKFVPKSDLNIAICKESCNKHLEKFTKSVSK